MNGKKIIETRTWNTSFRGQFYIHTSKTIDKAACTNFCYKPESLVRGSIIGLATLVDVKEYASQEEFLKDEGLHQAGFFAFSRPRFGFLLADVKRVLPIPYKGRLGFFRVDEQAFNK